MTVPSYRLEYKEIANFLVTAIENYCITDFFSLASRLPYD